MDRRLLPGRPREKAGQEKLLSLPLPVIYDEARIDIGFRLDLLVNDLVVVEVKATVKVNPIHETILLTYLRLSDHRVGLLINFHELHLRDGIRRIVNEF